MVGELASIGVQVLRGYPLMGLSVATVHYQHRVTTFKEPLGNPAVENQVPASTNTRIRQPFLRRTADQYAG